MTEYDKEYYHASIEALIYGKAYVSKGRKYVRHNGRSFPLSRALWNIGHPDDPVLITEVIHHKDGDKSNDECDNLEKLPAGKHMQLHVLNKRGEKLPKEKKGGGYWRREVLEKRPKTEEETKQRKLKREKKREKRKQELLKEMGIEYKLYSGFNKDAK